MLCCKNLVFGDQSVMCDIHEKVRFREFFELVLALHRNNDLTREVRLGERAKMQI